MLNRKEKEKEEQEERKKTRGKQKRNRDRKLEEEERRDILTDPLSLSAGPELGGGGAAGGPTPPRDKSDPGYATRLTILTASNFAATGSQPAIRRKKIN